MKIRIEAEVTNIEFVDGSSSPPHPTETVELTETETDVGPQAAHSRQRTISFSKDQIEGVTKIVASRFPMFARWIMILGGVAATAYAGYDLAVDEEHTESPIVIEEPAGATDNPVEGATEQPTSVPAPEQPTPTPIRAQRPQLYYSAPYHREYRDESDDPFTGTRGTTAIGTDA
jgi:hypothetical protein